MDIFFVIDVYILGINFLFISECNFEKKRIGKRLIVIYFKVRVI